MSHPQTRPRFPGKRKLGGDSKDAPNPSKSVKVLLGPLIGSGGYGWIFNSPKGEKVNSTSRGEFSMQKIAHALLPQNVPKPTRWYSKFPSNVDLNDHEKLREGKTKVYGIIEMEKCEHAIPLDKFDWIAKPNLLRKTFHSFAKSLKTLHSACIVHRDVTTMNALLTHEGPQAGTIWLIDYGLSFFIDGKPRPCGYSGRGYSAPEVRIGYTRKSDWYSYGITLYYCLKGKQKRLGKEKDSDEEDCSDCTSEWYSDSSSEPVYPPLPLISPSSPTFNAALRCFIAALTVEDPAERLGHQDILSWPWFQQDGDEWDAPFWQLCERRRTPEWLKPRVPLLWRIELFWGFKVKKLHNLTWPVTLEVVQELPDTDLGRSVVEVLLEEMKSRE